MRKVRVRGLELRVWGWLTVVNILTDSSPIYFIGYKHQNLNH